MTSATDKLRRMLDEREVKWEAPNSCLHDEMTSWTANKFEYEAIETPYNGFVLMATHQEELSPDKAIAATLGRGTCELREASWDDGTCTWGVICSACGAKHEHTHGYGWKFAPCCGAEVTR